MPPPSQAEAAVQTEVSEDGVHVSVQRENAAAPGVAVELRFESGDRVSGITNDLGKAILVPSVEQLFASSDFGTAKVVAAGHSEEVNLTPMIRAASASHQSEWAELTQSREQRYARADQAIGFVGPVYREANRQPFVDACAPSGTEVCGDGIDNDCNGRYDDASCGYHSGVVQFTASWSEDADVDLHVMGPDGVEVWKERPENDGAKLVMDKSCQPELRGRAGCPSGNVENVYVPASEVPFSGTYQAWLELDRVGSGAHYAPIPVMLSGRVGSRSWRTLVKLAPIPGASYSVAIPLGADQDHDSVIDSQDACVATPGCWFGDLKHRGCPDADQDAVPDSLDACPNLAGLDSENADKHGCPLVFGDASVTNDGVSIASRIEFAFGRAELEARSKGTLENVARALLALPSKVESIAVDGHTDEVGTEEDNMILSENRASTVLEALADLGVPATKLIARGFGETQPGATNDTPRGRQANRRVEFLVLKPKGTVSACWSVPAAGDTSPAK
jgi:outer membrane protein OmpA-like peptidoglycan-associated protein